MNLFCRNRLVLPSGIRIRVLHQDPLTQPVLWIGSGLDPDSTGSLYPDPGGQKITQKNWKQLINFIFWSAGCSLLRAEDFSCSLDEGLVISKLQFSIKKRYKQIFSYIFFHCLVIKIWIRGSGFTWNAGSGSASGSTYARLVRVYDGAYSTE